MEELEKIDILSLTKEELTGQITAMVRKHSARSRFMIGCMSRKFLIFRR